MHTRPFNKNIEKASFWNINSTRQSNQSIGVSSCITKKKKEKGNTDTKIYKAF